MGMVWFLSNDFMKYSQAFLRLSYMNYTLLTFVSMILNIILMYNHHQMHHLPYNALHKHVSNISSFMLHVFHFILSSISMFKLFILLPINIVCYITLHICSFMVCFCFNVILSLHILLSTVTIFIHELILLIVMNLCINHT